MFITFEGIEGSGKTTQVQELKSFLADQGYRCILTREPGGTIIGEKIRAILLDPGNKLICPQTELLLYIADRAQHVAEIIRPALSDNQVVICDRFADASVVYQGIARGLDADLITQLHHLVLENLAPEVTFLLDLPVETGLSRAWRRIDAGQEGTTESRFEEEDLAFHHRIRQGYLTLARREPHRFVIIDASRDTARVTSDIIAAIGTKIRDTGHPATQP